MKDKSNNFVENFTEIKNEDSKYISQLSIPIPEEQLPKNLLEVTKLLKYYTEKNNKKSIKINKNDLLLIVSLISNEIHISDIKNYTLSKILLDLWINSKEKNKDIFSNQIRIVKANKEKLKQLINSNMPKDIIDEINNGLEKYKVQQLFDNDSKNYNEIPIEIIEIVLEATHFINSEIDNKNAYEDVSSNTLDETKESKYSYKFICSICVVTVIIIFLIYYKLKID